MLMIKKDIKVNQCGYEAPLMAFLTLEAESSLVLCTSSVFEDLPLLGPDDEF